MAESFCCLALQMEVNVKQSLLLVSGGINSPDAKKVNARLSVCLLYFSLALPCGTFQNAAF